MARVAVSDDNNGKTRVVGTPSGQKIRRAVPDDLLVTLHRATLRSFNLMANGTGFDVHFIIPLSEAKELEALTGALQKLVTVDVRRFSRRRAEESP